MPPQEFGSPGGFVGVAVGVAVPVGVAVGEPVGVAVGDGEVGQVLVAEL